MTAYYNEIDPYAAQWLRNLIAAGHIAAGDVDERSITDVRADDLRPYTQCHFFAGIGVWSHALRLANWPDDKPVWTGSCPCQPFSVAGAGKGTSDERHLWPVWYDLIRECRPATIFGEQVEAAIRHGWLDLVQDDLENSGYTTGAICLPAACAGAPHIRQRLWFVADTDLQFSRPTKHQAGLGNLDGTSKTSNLLADTQRQQHQEPVSRPGQSDSSKGSWKAEQSTGLCSIDPLANTGSWGSQTWIPESEQREEGFSGIHDDGSNQYSRPETTLDSIHAMPGNFWDNADWLYCRDGKYRPVEPGTFPLAHGITNRVGRLRAYGNAINPQTAVEVISAYKEWSAPV